MLPLEDVDAGPCRDPALELAQSSRAISQAAVGTVQLGGIAAPDMLALDGVVIAADDGLAFHPTPPPADAEVAQPVTRIRSRVLHCARAIGASALLFVMGIAAEAAPPAPVSLRVLAPRAVSVNQPRDISVLITNGGATRVMVLPNMVRLRIEGIGAEYVPYPGPPIDPWDGARDLAPGATATILFPDTSDKRGVWRLPPGEYRITAVYEVPPDLSPPATIADPSQVWRGRLESPPATMTVK